MARLTNRLVRFYMWMAPVLLRRYNHVVSGVVTPMVARWVYRRVICYGTDCTDSKSATTANIWIFIFWSILQKNHVTKYKVAIFIQKMSAKLIAMTVYLTQYSG